MKGYCLIGLSTLLALGGVSIQDAMAQGGPGAKPGTLDPVAKAALLETLAGPEGEYAARAEYTAVIAQLGAVQPFVNIVAAEQKHVEALQDQCRKFGVPIPADLYEGKETEAGTLLQAAQIGVVAEIVNVAMYDADLAKPEVQLYPSLVKVFSNLRDASLYNHLPAFEAAVEKWSTP